MKAKFSLTALLSGNLLAVGIALASANATLACPYSQVKGLGQGKSLTLNPATKMGFLAVGTAAVSGLLAGGWFLLRRTGRGIGSETEVSDGEFFEVSSFSIPVPPEAIQPPVEEAIAEEPATSVR